MAWRKLLARAQPLLWIFGLLLIMLAGLQYRLWFAPSSLAEQHRLELQVIEQTEVNSKLRARNEAIEREVLELQSGTNGIEQRAREELGLIRKGETFYLVVEKDAPEPNKPVVNR